jgi:TPR repeat protein
VLSGSETASWLRKAAELGNASAQFKLGLMYWTGWNDGNGKWVATDYAAAVSWLRKAAEQGHAEAQGDLGIMYSRGQGVPKDYAAAVSWLRKAAEQGNAEALYYLEKVVIDSGAADVSVPADVVSTLMRVGAIREPDFIGENTYVLADGSPTKSPTFTIRTLKVGNTVLENVRGSVASPQASLLLGQSFLKRFKSWSIDNAKQELVLEPR